jgi:hypothetical protein
MSQRLPDLSQARRYLAEIATMSARAARSVDPLEVGLALELVRRPEPRPQRSREVYSLACFRCRAQIEIPCGGGPPYSCSRCNVPIEIQWLEARVT